MANIEDNNNTDTNNTNQVQSNIINNTETGSEDEEIIPAQSHETWEEFSNELEPPYGNLLTASTYMTRAFATHCTEQWCSRRASTRQR